MNLIWQWIKQNPWRFLTFLVGAISGSIAWILWPKGFVVYKPEVKPADPTVAAEKEKELAEEREEKILELEKQYKDQLAKATDAQLIDYEKMKEKPLEEIAQWLNKLS
jgi:hypothetical protein